MLAGREITMHVRRVRRLLRPDPLRASCGSRVSSLIHRWVVPVSFAGPPSRPRTHASFLSDLRGDLTAAAAAAEVTCRALRPDERPDRRAPLRPAGCCFRRGRRHDRSVCTFRACCSRRDSWDSCVRAARRDQRRWLFHVRVRASGWRQLRLLCTCSGRAAARYSHGRPRARRRWRHTLRLASPPGPRPRLTSVAPVWCRGRRPPHRHVHVPVPAGATGGRSHQPRCVPCAPRRVCRSVWGLCAVRRTERRPRSTSGSVGGVVVVALEQRSRRGRRSRRL